MENIQLKIIKLLKIFQINFKTSIYKIVKKLNFQNNLIFFKIFGTN